MILQILGAIIFAALVFIGLLAYTCARISTKPYPRKPENKDAQ